MQTPRPYDMPASTIHTFKGYKFRSRTEFTWAQEFEARALQWEYETVIFRVGKESYRPDFPLNNRKIFVEIKVEGARNLHNKFHLCTAPLLLIFGLPNRCYIRVKLAGAANFLPGRFRTFPLAYAFVLSRKAA